MTRGRAARAVVVAIGVWLMAAPAVLGYEGTAADVDRLAGPVAGSLAFLAIWPFLRALRWATLPVGVLLVLAPLLGYPAAAAVSSVASGLAIAGLALVGGPPEGSFGGGWRVLVRGRRRRPA